MSIVLDELLAIRSRMAAGEVRNKRLHRFEGMAGIPAQQLPAKFTTFSRQREFYRVLDSDGQGTMEFWRSAVRDVFERGRVLVVPNTAQLYSHSYLPRKEAVGCGLRFVVNTVFPAKVSMWMPKFTNQRQDMPESEQRDVKSARFMIKAVHSENKHFDDESMYNEIEVI
jgi:hypothetical protein